MGGGGHIQQHPHSQKSHKSKIMQVIIIAGDGGFFFVVFVFN